MVAERYDLYSEKIPRDEAEEIMEKAVRQRNDLRRLGIHSDFQHFLEPNGSGFDLVQLADSGSSYTPIYYHIGDESVQKEGSIGWDRAVEMLSYDPRELV